MVISRAVVGKKIFGRQTDGVQALGNDYTHGPTIPGPDYIHGLTVLSSSAIMYRQRVGKYL